MKCNNPNCENEAKVKYCSRSCSAKINNSKHPKRRSTNGYDPNRACLWCGSKVNSGYSTHCSISCASKTTEAKKASDWLAGTVVDKSEYGPMKAVRNFLLEEAEYRCSSDSCLVPGGWGVVSEATGRVPLQIDHTDGNSRNNSRENLRVLCPNCHSLTETFGALNKGNGRKYRYAT